MSLQFDPGPMERAQQLKQQILQQNQQNQQNQIGAIGNIFHNLQGYKQQQSELDRQKMMDAMTKQNFQNQQTQFNQQQQDYRDQHTPLAPPTSAPTYDQMGGNQNPATFPSLGGNPSPMPGSPLADQNQGQPSQNTTRSLSLFQGQPTNPGRSKLVDDFNRFALAVGHPQLPHPGQELAKNGDISPSGVPYGTSPADYKERMGYEKDQQGLELGKSSISKNYAAAQKDLFDASGKKTDLTLSTKEDQFYQKEWDKIVKDSDPLNTTSRSGLGIAAKADFNANRALTTLMKPVVTNQEAGNVMADIASIYQGGSATQYGMSHQAYQSLYGKIQGALQYVSGNPQDALPNETKQRLIQVLNEMKSTNKAVIKQQLDHLERAQPKVIGRFKDEWQGIRSNLEGGVAGGPSEQTPEDYLKSIGAKITSANLEWAKTKIGGK